MNFYICNHCEEGFKIYQEIKREKLSFCPSCGYMQLEEKTPSISWSAQLKKFFKKEDTIIKFEPNNMIGIAGENLPEGAYCILNPQTGLLMLDRNHKIKDSMDRLIIKLENNL